MYTTVAVLENFMEPYSNTMGHEEPIIYRINFPCITFRPVETHVHFYHFGTNSNKILHKIRNVFSNKSRNKLVLVL